MYRRQGDELIGAWKCEVLILYARHDHQGARWCHKLRRVVAGSSLPYMCHRVLGIGVCTQRLDFNVQTAPPKLRKLSPPNIPRLNRPRLLTPHPRINLIHSIERQVQELMLIIPPDVLLLKLLQFLGRRRRLRDLRNKVSRRRFGDSVDQDAQERDFQEEEESDGEAVEHAAAVVEPEFLLLGGVADAGEVGVELGGWLGAGFFVV
jgi:hypothetical protein